MKKSLFLLLILAFSLNYAQMGRKQNPDFCRFNLPELNLSQEQLNDINTLRLQLQEKMIDLRAKLDLLRLEVKKERIGNMDFDKIKQLKKDMNNLKNNMSDLRIDMQKEMFNKLSDEQKAVWKKYKNNWENSCPGSGKGGNRPGKGGRF